MRLFGRKKEVKPLSEERKKEYFEFGKRMSLKLGLPEKIEKTNAFYARHPKAMSFCILGVCCLLMTLSNITFAGAEKHPYKNIGEQASDYTASPLFDAMEMHSDNMEKLDGINKYHDKLVAVIDSLKKLENPTKEDSLKLQEGITILKKIEGDTQNGL